MRIVRIDVFAKSYKIAGGTFAMSGGKTASEQDATIVRIETDDGIVGWGEQCGFSPRYLAAHGEGARAALALMAPAVIGLDSRAVQRVYDAMDGALKGHDYAKSALDMACWDVLGRASGLPLQDLLGGGYRVQLPVYIGIGIGTPQRMRESCERARAAGYRRIQLKVGSDVPTDIARIEACLEVLADFEKIIVDANGFWRHHAHSAGPRSLPSSRPCNDRRRFGRRRHCERRDGAGCRHHPGWPPDQCFAHRADGRGTDRDRLVSARRRGGRHAAARVGPWNHDRRVSSRYADTHIRRLTAITQMVPRELNECSWRRSHPWWRR